MKTSKVPFRQLLNIMALIILFPLSGIMLAGKDVAPYLHFPPKDLYVEHAPFSWVVFLLMAIGILAVVLPLAIRVIRSQATVTPPPLAGAPFPLWGWIGIALGVASWILAWNRFTWFEPIQRFTFTPLWISYILVVNAWTLKRSGTCMLQSRPGYTALLFLFSAGFWWCFEYLNRFVQNWVYVGLDHISTTQYILEATPPFATVLPAVLGTTALLETMPRLSAGLENFLKFNLPRPRLWAAAGGLAGSAGLLAVGIRPNELYPLLWVAPLILIASLQAWNGQVTVLTALRDGNWKRVWLLALGALICGFFWELWNWKSLAKWTYLVPYVQKFHLFEMPILGYAGYLPFGLECALIADMLKARPASNIAAAPAQRPPSQTIVRLRTLNMVFAIVIAAYFFILPGFKVMKHLNDPAIAKGEVPQLAIDLHRHLTPKYKAYARARVESAKAGKLNLYDVPSTEWPMFGSVYFLWATENLQAAWEQNPVGPEPAVYARDAIEASTDLIMDPVHHSWVKTHWGENYMHRENVFFRALIIAGITARENLIGDGKHLDVLRDQIVTLARDLDASPHGVLNDYPGECYPIDVLCAIACIQRADPLAGTDHSAFIERAIRGFEGHMTDRRGLIPYRVDPISAEQFQPSRGVGNSFILIFSRELWPDKSDYWMARYEEHFWQDRGWAAGFREFPADMPEWEWGFDVDAGPILAGFSPAANAFGLSAATINGRHDLAQTLWNQILPACWPLPGGELLGPKILSDWEHAPYLGEACMLYFMSARVAPGVDTKQGGQVPGLTWIGFAFFFGMGALIIALSYRSWKHKRTQWAACPNIQIVLWAISTAAALALFISGAMIWGLIMVRVALFFPASITLGAGGTPSRQGA